MFRESYTAEEWRTLQFAPIWAFSLTAGVDGEIDSKETGAFVNQLTELAKSKEPLIREVLDSNIANLMEAYKADPRAVIAGLKDVVELLDRKATQEQAESFKRTMLSIGRNISQASGGGLFSVTGKVSAAEETAFALLAMTLRVPELETASAHPA